MKSIWLNTASLNEFEKLNGDKKTDVLIIGGGLCGVLCAYFLEKHGIDYILLEGETILDGVTKYTTAKITSQHGLIYNDLIKKVGLDNAKKFLTANEKAISMYRELCKNIDCDFENKSSFVYSLKNDKKIEKELNALEKLKFNATFVNDTPLPFEISGAVEFKNQAQFNPAKFVQNISKGLNIYEHSFVKEMKGNVAITDGGRVTAKKVIVATHFPFINKHGFYFLKMYQHRSYVLALENAKNVEGMYVDEDKKGLSFRNYNGLLLLGGGSHRTGSNGGNFNELRELKNKYYPNAKEVYAFATQDCMTLDGMAYIGKYSKRTPNLFVASGFNKWGMTSSMLSAHILTDLVLDRENEYADLFSPQRNMYKPQLVKNIGSALKGWLTISKRRCPHLGCALKWNKVEHTWDCSCHGSRFTENGKLINNPATADLKKKFKK